MCPFGRAGHTAFEEVGRMTKVMHASRTLRFLRRRAPRRFPTSPGSKWGNLFHVDDAHPLTSASVDRSEVVALYED